MRAHSRRLSETLLFFFLLVFLLPSLACAQAGEILTPAEATARANPQAQNGLGDGGGTSATPSPGAVDTPAIETPFTIGEDAYLAGKGFLVNLVDAPGGNRIVGSQERGAKVTVLEILQQGETVWVRIQAPTGEGWVKVENLTVNP